MGSRYQTEVTPLLREPDIDTRKLEELESLVWTPNHALSDRKIDQFLVVSRSVGTFARALDCSSSVKQPSLHMSAAAASRDITLVCDDWHLLGFTSILIWEFIFGSVFLCSFMRWTPCINTTIQSNRPCARWCRQAAQYCVATKWRNGVRPKPIYSKKRWINTAKISRIFDKTL